MTPRPIPHRDFTFVLTDNARILVVDDDPVQCEFAPVHLQTPTAEFETATDGVEGMRRLMNEQFDLALIDLEMPVLDGFEMIHRIRLDPKLRTLPIVVVTGHDDVHSIDRTFEAGATNFVAKPVNRRLPSYQPKFILQAHRAACAA